MRKRTRRKNTPCPLRLPEGKIQALETLLTDIDADTSGQLPDYQQRTLDIFENTTHAALIAVHLCVAICRFMSGDIVGGFDSLARAVLEVIKWIRDHLVRKRE